MKVKKAYSAPGIEVIKLDNEISLQLASPPTGPGEESMVSPQGTSSSMDATEQDPYHYETW